MNVRPQESRIQSSSSYPPFTPHITLASLPNIPDKPLGDILPQSQKPIQAHFERLVSSRVYFRSAYIGIALSPNLSQLHAHVHEQLGIEPKTQAFPHLSLVYIDDEDKEERERYAQELKRQGWIKDLSDDEIEVRDAEKGVGLKSVEITEVWTVECVGPIQDWKVLEKHSLTV